jgi:hypothetical protein
MISRNLPTDKLREPAERLSSYVGWRIVKIQGAVGSFTNYLGQADPIE